MTDAEKAKPKPAGSPKTAVAPKLGVAPKPKVATAPKPTVAAKPTVAPKPAATSAPKPAAVPKPKIKVDASRVSTGGKQADASEEENQQKARKGALFILGVLGVYVVFLIITGQMAQFIDALQNVDGRWVFYACLGYMGYFVFGVFAYVIAVWLDHDSPVGVRDLMSVESSGVFFGNLTPMMAGAVPSQIYRLTRTGLDVGEASATQFTRFIMFQFALVLFAFLMLLARFEFFLNTYGDIVFLNLVVFGLHTLELVMLFVICLCPKFVKRVGNWVINLADKHKWLKDYDRWYEMVNTQVDEFSATFKRAASDIPNMALTCVVTMCQLFCLYVMPWFILKAFGIDEDFLTCLAAGSMVQLVSTAVPLPGGTGGAEGGFALFFGGMFGAKATAGFLVWRLCSFIGPTLFAVPFLGIRSNRTESIYHEVNRRMAARRARAASGGKRAKKPAGIKLPTNKLRGRRK